MKMFKEYTQEAYDKAIEEFYSLFIENSYNKALRGNRNSFVYRIDKNRIDCIKNLVKRYDATFRFNNYGFKNIHDKLNKAFKNLNHECCIRLDFILIYGDIFMIDIHFDLTKVKSGFNYGH